jgi:hypothetical protein
LSVSRAFVDVGWVSTYLCWMTLSLAS